MRWTYQIRTLSYDDGFSLTGLKENYDTQGRFVVAEIEIVAMYSIDGDMNAQSKRWIRQRGNLRFMMPAKILPNA